ncbi:hypothetical protein K504DRAFT_241452 [Pleomassaria siparia CBS 279.74]|uniref:Uncharacterized protein n=1 Tax=Pleomassaria siparia CBS 279.74 TaxID=1314801 RepID=A0A6G1KES5_9PLEO|nr:hypothetical protein K504DRAFT_241452 [Pleomassaria siparia CBS 279.74]
MVCQRRKKPQRTSLYLLCTRACSTGRRGSASRILAPALTVRFRLLRAGLARIIRILFAALAPTNLLRSPYTHMPTR